MSLRSELLEAYRDISSTITDKADKAEQSGNSEKIENFIQTLKDAREAIKNSQVFQQLGFGIASLCKVKEEIYESEDAQGYALNNRIDLVNNVIPAKDGEVFTLIDNTLTKLQDTLFAIKGPFQLKLI